MNRYLFVFGYESPAERRSNVAHGSDYESSSAVWIRADSRDDALSEGRAYAEQFVAREFRKAGESATSHWAASDFAHWISEDPATEFAEADLRELPEIQAKIHDA